MVSFWIRLAKRDDKPDPAYVPLLPLIISERIRLQILHTVFCENLQLFDREINMKYIKTVSALLIMVLLFTVGCTKHYDPINVGIVLTVEGPGDNSFNDNALAALERAKADYKISYDYRVPKSAADIEKTINYFAKKKYDLVIATGFLMHDACESIADRYPETEFVIIDS